jgi:UDP-GlcNAc:undecaprenyl-phosphate GlcNAc-1-phosphate transferase
MNPIIHRLFHPAASQLIWLGILALIYALVFTPLIGNLFRRLGMLDQPGARKIHVDPVPRVGGISIAIAYAGSFATLLLLPLPFRDVIASGVPLIFSLLPASGLIFFTGLLDDLIGLQPWQKLFPQFLAAVMACSAGVMFRIAPDHAGAAFWNVPITLLWLISCTNAFNLIDGLDGLAGGVGLCATVAMLLSALTHDNFVLAAVAAPLAGCLLGFLKYNFNPASVFLGDCGSLLLGFELGCFGVVWSQQSASPSGIALPLMTLAIPLLDVALAVVRRFLTNRPIFSPDKSHIHHQLLKQGLSPRRAALVIYACSGLAAALALLWNVLPERFGGMIGLLFCVAVWIGIRRLRYVEFGSNRDVMQQVAFRELVEPPYKAPQQR